MNVTLTPSADGKTATLAWTPPVGQEGFVATIDGVEQSIDGKRHFSASKTTGTMKVGLLQDGKSHLYGVNILGVLDSGAQAYPAVSPPPSPPTAVAAPGSTGMPVTTLPYSDSILLNVQSPNVAKSDYVMDAGGGDSSVLCGSGGKFISGVHLSRFRLGNVAVGNKVSWGKHGVYADCFNSIFEDFEIHGSSHAANGFSIRMGGCRFSRAVIDGCSFPVGIFDSDTGQSDGTVLVEDVTGAFHGDTAVWCDAQLDFKNTFDLKVTFLRCAMTGPGAFLKVETSRMGKGSFRFESCILNGKPVTSADVPAGSVIA